MRIFVKINFFFNQDLQIYMDFLSFFGKPIDVGKLSISTCCSEHQIQLSLTGEMDLCTRFV